MTVRLVEAEPDKHFPSREGPVDLFDGEARDVRVGPAADAQKCDFVVTAPYSLERGGHEAARCDQGMLQGKLG